MTKEDDIFWNYCEVVWKGQPCFNKARYRNGKKCCTCFNRLATAKDPERVAKYHKDYYAKNPEAVKAKQKRYYDSHRQQEKERNFLYRFNKAEKILEYERNVRQPKRKAERAAQRAIRAQAASQARVCPQVGKSGS